MMRVERASPSAAHWTETQYQQLFQQPDGPSERLVLVVEATRDEVPNAGAASLPGLPVSGVVAFLVARRVATEWELENIVVGPEARRNGFGRRLLDALIAHAAQTNSECVFLEVRESNWVARKLYEKAGFQQTATRKSYYANPLEDAVVYRRNL